MSDSLDRAIQLLQPDGLSIWRWSDCREIVEWRSGHTFAFREELAVVVNRLAPRGLPAMNMLMMLLAATRDNWPDASGTDGEFHDLGHLFREFRLPSSLVLEVLSGLERVACLDAELRGSPAAKANLAEVVFEQAPVRIAPTDAMVVSHFLQHGIPLPETGSSDDTVIVQTRKAEADLRGLADGLRAIHADSLRLRLQTGLDQTPRPPEDLELVNTVQMARSLVRELRNDVELSGLAQLSRNLSSLVMFKRPLDVVDDLPVGGVSDISNRGSLERLLLSELAQDDLTLAVRVAVGEALYFRREASVMSPPRPRFILLDSGIRSWGLPRIFGTAAALAIVTTSNPHGRVRTWRATSQYAVEIDLASREGLVEHLGVLVPDVHPGKALANFVAEADAMEEPAELFLVISRDAWNDDDFRHCLREAVRQPLVAAVIARDGRFELWSWAPTSTKLLRRATVDLQQLLPERRPAHSLSLSTNNLPAIFQQPTFPLRLSVNINLDLAAPIRGHGILQLIADGRLLYWDNLSLGAIQLADGLPNGRILWRSCQPTDGRLQVLLGKSGSDEKRLIHIDISQHAHVVDVTPTRLVSGVSYAEHNGALISVGHTGAEAVSLNSGRLVDRIDYPRIQRWHGRVLLDESMAWRALHWNGTKLSLVELVDSQRTRELALGVLFQPYGSPGFVGLTTDGKVYETVDERLTTLVLQIGHLHWPSLRISADGNVVHGMLTIPHQPLDKRLPFILRFDDQNHICEWTSGTFWQLEWTEEVTNAGHFRNRFEGIGVVGGTLVLVARKGWLVLEHRDNVPYWTPHQLPPTGTLPPSVPLVPQVPAEAPRYKLKVARLGGLEFILDSRGLLHLRATDGRLTEVTIVLSERRTAMWCADGRMSGTRYYLGSRTSTAAEGLLGDVIRPLLERAK